MRQFATALALCAVVALPVAGFAGDPAKEPAKQEKEGKDKKAHNHWCPVTGKKVDAAVPPVEVKVKDKEGKDKTVLIAVADKASAEVIAKANDEQKQLFADAAKKRQKVENGKLVKIAEAEEEKAEKAAKGEKDEKKDGEKK
jgi:hypothetical protein